MAYFIDSIAPFLALFGIGIVASFINSISGGGSILSLPLLVFFGLPSAEANGTNRLGVLMGSIGTLVGFRSHGIFLPRLTWQVGWPAALGSLLGSLLAVQMPDRFFNPILAFIITLVVILTFRGHRIRGTIEETLAVRQDWLALSAYTLIGFYGGFIQAGSGLIMLYVFGKFSNLNLFHINALKVSNTILFISVSIVTFVLAGKINWPMALALGLGNLVGGWVGSHWQIKKGEVWVNRFLLFSGLAMAAKLLWDTWAA